jgi:hypothetical protein
MQRNKVYAVTVIAAVAEQLGVDEDLLHEISVGLEPEDGVICVVSIRRRPQGATGELASA